MIGQWKLDPSFSGSFKYTGNDNILKDIASYDKYGSRVFYIRCAVSNQTDELLKRVQDSFIKTIKEILSSESLDQQLQQADCKRKDYLANSEGVLKIPDFALSKGSFFDFKYKQLRFETPCGRYVSIFIHVLDAVFKLGETADQIHTYYDIQPAIFNLLVLKTYVDQQNYEKAIKGAENAAKWPRYQNIQFELAQYLEEKQQIDLAYQVYDSIKQEHPLFEMAKERMFYIIQNSKSAIEQMSIPQSDQEKEELLVQELDVMMALPVEQQFLIDQRIHALCGKRDLQPVLTNVRYDGNTVLAFCKHIEELNKKIAQLESATKK